MTTTRWRRHVCVAAAAVLIPVAVFTGGSAQASACGSHVASDFNGDGFADLATGAVDADDIGAVQISYGSAAGVDEAKTQLITPSSPGMPEPSASYEGFATAVTSGNFNGDCYADLAIGSRYFTDSGHLDVGEVTILYGSATGLRTTGATEVFGPATASDFGRSMTSGDFNRDGYADLAVGAPNANGNPGQIGVVYGDASGIHGTPTWFSLNSAGVPGSSAASDDFGFAVAAGDFDGNGYADLAVGVPGQKDGTVKFGGEIVLLPGTASGLSGSGSTVITQETAGVPGDSETGDHLGSALATGDINGDGRADLVVGVPDESIGSLAGAGDIMYLPGTATGITGAGAARFSLHTTGIPGVAKANANAGYSVAVGDVDADGHADIVFGLPYDKIGSIEGGTAVVLEGSASGPTVTGAKILSQITAGIPGTPEDGDEFGLAVHVVGLYGPGPADVIVGAPFEVSPDHSGYAVIIPDQPGTGVTGVGSVSIAQASTTINNFGASFS
jgi:hypothetical protein